jgi:hypothetical protein
VEKASLKAWDFYEPFFLWNPFNNNPNNLVPMPSLYETKSLKRVTTCNGKG